MRTQALALAFVLAGGTAHAGGLILNDHGAEAAGRADAVVATDTKGSAIFYNPAGLAFADGYNIMVGGSIVYPMVDFTEAESGEITDGVRGASYTPQLFLNGKIGEVIAVGAGVHAPFGARSQWPSDSPGREQTVDSRLRTLFFSGVVAADLSRYVPGRLSIGGGFDVVPGDVEIERVLVFGQDEGTARLAGQTLGYGARAGVMYEPIPAVSLGVSWRSQVELNFSGDADIDIAPPYRSQLPPDGRITTSDLNLPQSVFAGVAYRPSILPGLELEFDFNWIDWSSLDVTQIIFSDGSQTPLAFNWEDGYAYRFGFEYGTSVGVDFRAGFAIDRTPIPDTSLAFSPPDANRYNITGGFSYNLPKRGFVDFGVVYGIPVSNTTSDEPLMPPVKGEFNISFFVASLSLGVKFDAE